MNIWESQLGSDFMQTLMHFIQQKSESKQYTVLADGNTLEKLQKCIDIELEKGAKYIGTIPAFFTNGYMILIFEK